MTMSKRGKRALLSLLRQFRDSEEGNAPNEGQNPPTYDHLVDYLAENVGAQPTRLWSVRGVVTLADEAENRRSRTYVVSGRSASDAVAKAIHAALQDSGVQSAYDVDFHAAEVTAPAYLASEGVEG